MERQKERKTESKSKNQSKGLKCQKKDRQTEGWKLLKDSYKIMRDKSKQIVKYNKKIFILIAKP